MWKIKIFLLLLLLNCFNDSLAQINKEFDSKILFVKNENGGKKFYYIPSPKINLPDKIEVIAIYSINNVYINKTFPTQKKRDRYEFVISLPDSAPFIMAIVNSRLNYNDYNPLMAFRKEIVDNNNGSGFIFKPSIKSIDVELSIIDLISNYSSYFLNLDVKKDSLLKQYDKQEKLNPNFKISKNYLDYLYLSFDKEEVNAESRLKSYAINIDKYWKIEEDLIVASKIYKRIQSIQQYDSVILKINQLYPYGILAKQNYWKTFYEKDIFLSEGEILDSMQKYVSRFQDSSIKIKDNFFIKILSLQFAKKQYDSVFESGKLISSKYSLAFMYNSYAKKLISRNEDLNTSKIFSKISIDLALESRNNAYANSQDYLSLTGSYYKFLYTYATVLYKLNQFDSAFYFLNSMYLKSNCLDNKGLELYAQTCEKVKGLNYTKNVIEKILLEGTNSEILLTQLLSINKRLLLSADDFEIAKLKASKIYQKKNEQMIKTVIGNLKAPSFSLKDINDNVISLESLKGKVVVLDFWATWCLPCRASFPSMQKLVSEYKNDTNVVFLFIDVWEYKKLNLMRESAIKLLKEGNFQFNVLFDEKNKVVEDYKIKAIPSKFVINKKGEIVFIGDSINDITTCINFEKGEVP